MLKKLVFLPAVAWFMVSCSMNEQETNVGIQGNFPGMADQWIYLDELEPVSLVGLDSALIGKDGNFRFELTVDDAGFYILRTSPDNQLLLLLEKGEHVTLQTTSESLDSNTGLEGSTGSLQILDFERFMDLQRTRIDSLAKVYNAYRGAPEFFDVKNRLDSLYLMYMEEQREYVFNFVEAHPGSLANLIMINRRLGQADVIDEEKDYAYLYRIDSALQQKYPGNIHTQDHHERVMEIKGRIFDKYVIEEKLSQGRKAPDVVLNDTAGQPVSLKSYTGKKVILYFWAGWSARSREDNLRLVKVYQELNGKNVEVLGISLDENETVWKGAIRLDKLLWPQLSDLQGLHSPIGKAYNIPADLPFYYLIDEQQKIDFKHAMLDSVLVRLN